MYVLSVSEMRKADNETINNIKIPSLVLMENAGKSVADIILKKCEICYDDLIIIVSGPGNNGGDGLVAARLLKNYGYNVEVFFTSPEKKFSKDCSFQFSLIKKFEIPFFFLESEEKNFLLKIKKSQIIIDAIFGTGFRGKIKDNLIPIIENINSSLSFIVAIDIPSGVNGDMGQIENIAIFADITVTMAALKKGHILLPGRLNAGEIVVSDISIKNKYIKEISSVKLITSTLVKNILNIRKPWSHKGNFGKVLIVGGSFNMSGAPKLSGRAALKTGSGLITLAAPEKVISSFSCFEEAISITLNKGTTLDLEGADIILDNINKYDVLLIGPGLGLCEETRKAVVKILKNINIPAVIDADALTIISEKLDIIKGKKVVLTPHLGEMSRLCELSINEISNNPLTILKKFSEKTGVIIHLKGPLGQISDPYINKLFVSPIIEDALATAGSGDVLSGIIASLIGQGMNVSEAVIAGVYIHAIAGIEAKKVYGSRSTTAISIINNIYRAFEKINLNENFSNINSFIDL